MRGPSVAPGTYHKTVTQEAEKRRRRAKNPTYLIVICQVYTLCAARWSGHVLIT